MKHKSTCIIVITLLLMAFLASCITSTDEKDNPRDISVQIQNHTGYDAPKAYYKVTGQLSWEYIHLPVALPNGSSFTTSITQQNDKTKFDFILVPEGDICFAKIGVAFPYSQQSGFNVTISAADRFFTTDQIRIKNGETFYSSGSITEVYIRSTGTSSWGPNRLTGEPIPYQGGTRNVSLPLPLSIQNVYDIRVRYFSEFRERLGVPTTNNMEIVFDY